MMHDFPFATFKFLGFWKNSRNRLASIHSRQAKHVESVVFWVPAMNRLAVKPCTVRRYKH